ncbi:hypothetical protein EYF80_046756 [Liparis tanakae]|uniref:Uncharacterized protein n=1 Tax=Liparis tanakae TaxID=230148 RepID=A0A4Z2FP89_9TELE|nr:hypothetical protein EYF80_046756 [Liparis tanakae]
MLRKHSFQGTIKLPFETSQVFLVDPTARHKQALLLTCTAYTQKFSLARSLLYLPDGNMALESRRKKTASGSACLGPVLSDMRRNAEMEGQEYKKGEMEDNRLFFKQVETEGRQL